MTGELVLDREAGAGAAAEENGAAEEDPTQLGPRPENLMPRTGGVAAAAADGAADGIYRPPKLNPAAMQVAVFSFDLCRAISIVAQYSLHVCCALARQTSRESHLLLWLSRDSLTLPSHPQPAEVAEQVSRVV